MSREQPEVDHAAGHDADGGTGVDDAGRDADPDNDDAGDDDSNNDAWDDDAGDDVH